MAADTDRIKATTTAAYRARNSARAGRAAVASGYGRLATSAISKVTRLIVADAPGGVGSFAADGAAGVGDTQVGALPGGREGAAAAHPRRIWIETGR